MSTGRITSNNDIIGVASKDPDLVLDPTKGTFAVNQLGWVWGGRSKTVAN
jgi:hypothetical protein